MAQNSCKAPRFLKSELTIRTFVEVIKPISAVKVFSHEITLCFGGIFHIAWKLFSDTVSAIDEISIVGFCRFVRVSENGVRGESNIQHKGLPKRDGNRFNTAIGQIDARNGARKTVEIPIK